jgi:hypothetical protein
VGEGKSVAVVYLVRYVAAEFALSGEVVKARYARTRSFRTEAEALAFVRELWKGRDWRVLDVVTAGGGQCRHDRAF